VAVLMIHGIGPYSARSPPRHELPIVGERDWTSPANSERLAALHRAGDLTADEYPAAKAALIGP
jgi:hypothetical protein